MRDDKRSTNEVLLAEALLPQSSQARSGAVLSCGGIFLPRRAEDERLHHHIITTSSQKEPVKIVTGARPRNLLREMMLKESLN